jgi:hypothetical protein
VGVVGVHHGVALAARDQPAVDREGDDARDEQADGQAPPEQSAQPHQVDGIMPSTSPIAQPLRQCTVAPRASVLTERWR